MSDIANIVNHIEWTRKQLEDLQKMFGDDPKYAAVVKAAKELEAKAIATEGKFIDVNLTGRTEDSFRAPMALYGRLANLGALMNGAPGEGSSGADLPPTDQAVAVHNMFKQEIAAAQRSFEELRDKDTPAFNETLKANHVSMSILP